MISSHLDQRLIEVLGTEISKISSVLFEQIDKNTYRFFDRYTVIKTRRGYVVSRGATEIPQNFHSLRSALSWCIADQRHRYDLAQDIRNYDQIVFNLEQSIDHFEAVRNKTRDRDRREILLIKSEDSRVKLTHAKNALDKCINLAKYIQTRGFTNEAPRNGRNASLKTSR